MSGACVVLLAAIWAGPVELRGGVMVEAPVEEVSIRGVRVGGDEARTIGWDNVKRVIGEGSEEAAAYMGMAERAWRARIRLARGDFGMASGLLEGLFERLRGEDGPTALMVAEGTMACRLWFGDRVEAVEAWLEAVRLREAGFRIAGDPPLNPVLDPETLLAPGLSPVWLETDALVELAESWEGGAVESGDVAGRLRVLYAASARRELGMEVDADAVGAAAFGGASHPGVSLVGQMVEAMSGDGTRREAAREALRAGLEGEMGTWREAWRRAALGRSLLMEQSDAERVAGLFELVHLPARFSRSQRYLAGVALAEMSVELMRRGDAASGERLREELETRHPGHPALRWIEEREWRARANGQSDGSGDGPQTESETTDERDD